MGASLSNLSSSILDYKRQGQAIFNRGSSVFALFFVREEKNTGFPITNVGNDESGYFRINDSLFYTSLKRQIKIRTDSAKH